MQTELVLPRGYRLKKRVLECVPVGYGINRRASSSGKRSGLDEVPGLCGMRARALEGGIVNSSAMFGGRKALRHGVDLLGAPGSKIPSFQVPKRHVDATC